MARLLRIIALMLTVAPPAPGQGDKAKSDLERLEGTWVLVGTEAAIHPSRITFKGEKFTLDDDEGVREGGAVKLDAKPSPKQIDMTFKEGNKRVGIYKLEDDEFTVCVVNPDQDRPTEFDSKPGVVINRWRRVRPSK